MPRVIVVALALLLPVAASAQTHDASDRVAFGSGVVVRPGEVVRDAVAFGGDTIVEGEVLGDAVAFGGSVLVRGRGRVHGDMTSFGGRIDDARGVAPPIAQPTALGGFGRWLGELGRSAVSHALLFLLGLLLMGVARERLRALQATIVRDGPRTAGVGLLAYVGAVLAMIVLAITIVGIPAAVLLGLALPVATYVGLAASASVIGAALPIRELAGKEVGQLAAGVLVLFVAAQVPVVGTIATIVAACLGVGALVRTRFAVHPPELPEPTEGPYRSAAG